MLPLTPLYLKFIAALFGYSLKAVHFASSLCGAVSLVFSCLMTKELRGGSYAIFLTGLFSLISGFITFGALFSYDSLEFLLIVIALYLLVRIINSGNQKLWLLFGLVMGLGLSNKLTILFFGLSVFVSLWLVPQRKYFKEKWIWLAGIIALIFLIPYGIWQSKNGWYFLSFAQNYAGGESYIATIPEFIWNQLIGNNVLNSPVWFLGLWLLLFSKNWARYRFFGINYVVLFLIFFFVGAKFYFLIPMYSILLAVGSVKLEKVILRFNGSPLKHAFLKYAMPVIYVIFSLPTLALGMPLLSVESFIQLTKYIGVDAGVKTSYVQMRQLPHHFADRFGWEEMVKELLKVYNNIPSDKKDNVGIIAENWGEASAVNFFRKKYRLPEATCADGWYYYETLRKKNFKDIYISFGLSKSDLSEIFNSVVQEGLFTNDYCLPSENNKPLFLCSSPKCDLNKYWTILKNIDDHFLNLVHTGKIDSAIVYYHHHKNIDSTTLMFTERQIYFLGHGFLKKGKIEDAMKLFSFNLEVFPFSSYAYYGLGEAYLKKGNRELAIKNYKKILELYPDNTHARKKLLELEKL